MGTMALTRLWKRNVSITRASCGSRSSFRMKIDLKIVLLVVVVSLGLISDGEGCGGSRSGSRSSSGNKRPSHDIKTKSGLTTLYNQKVAKAQPVERKLDGLNNGKITKAGVGLAKVLGIKTSISKQKNRATHSGMLVTTNNGKKYLVHKGKGYGVKSQTVVVNSKHMSKNWKTVGSSQNVGGKKTVGDYVKAGGKDYSLKGGNCHDATGNMKKLGGNRRKRCA